MKGLFDRVFSKVTPLLAGLILFFVSLINTIPLSAQPGSDDSVRIREAFDRLSGSISEGTWSDVTIYELSSAERAALLAKLPSVEWIYDPEEEEVVAALEKIGQIIAPGPLDVALFTNIALLASRDSGGFEAFRRIICARFNEYDCEYDFDPDLLRQAYSIAGEIVEYRKRIPPRVYMVVSSTGEPLGIFGSDNLDGPEYADRYRLGTGLFPEAQAGKPIVRILSPSSELYWYTGAKFRIPVVAEVGEGGAVSTNVGTIVEDSDDTYLVWDYPVQGSTEIVVQGRTNDGLAASDTKVLYVERPELAMEPRRLPFSRATVGSLYRPNTVWKSLQIVPDHYLTVVRFGDRDVFARRGTDFTIDVLPDALLVRDDSIPIKMTVYWLPAGVRENRVPIFSTDPAVQPVAPEYMLPPVKASYKAPEYSGPFKWTFQVNSTTKEVLFDGIRADQLVGVDQRAGIESIDVMCAECNAYGIEQPRVVQSDPYNWLLKVEIVDRAKFDGFGERIDGKIFLVDLVLHGLGDQPGAVTVDFEVDLAD